MNLSLRTVSMNMKPFMFGLRDWWSQWAIDRAGVESGNYQPSALRELLDGGQIGAHTWLRHRWTRRFALSGEVLYLNDLATEEEFESWFPNPRFRPGHNGERLTARG